MTRHEDRDNSAELIDAEADDGTPRRRITLFRLSLVVAVLLVAAAVVTAWWEGRRRPAAGADAARDRARFDASSDTATSAARLQPELSDSPHELIVDGQLYYLGSDTTYGFTASYAIATSEGIVVIDPGLRYGVLAESLRSLGLNVTDVKKVLVTHHHADHWFSARELVQRTGAELFAHRETARWMTQAGDLRQYYTMYAKPILEVPTVGDVQPLEDGDVLRMGQVAIEVLGTPGHTPGSLCFLTRLRDYDILFSGDTIMTLSPEAADGDYMTRLGPRFGGDIRAYQATLERLRQVPFDLLLPGHPLLGKQFDAARGAVLWRQRVAAKLAALAARSAAPRESRDGFLDGRPKQLAQGLAYLGEEDATACYAFETDDGIVCVDPGRRTREQLNELLTAAGLDSVRLKFVVLTGIHADHAENARKICEQAGAQLWCGSLEGSAAARERLRPDHEFAPFETRALGAVAIQALPGIRGAGADLCLLVRMGEQIVLFGGDSVGRFARPKTGYHASIEEATVPAESMAREAVKRVMGESIAWVLPAHPQLDEAAYYQPGEWQRRGDRP